MSSNKAAAAAATATKANALLLPYCAPVDRECKLFVHVSVYDGRADRLVEDTSVLVTGNKISKIAREIASGDDYDPETTLVVDGRNRYTLMPGVVAMHEHVMLQFGYRDFYTRDTRFVACLSTETARTYLFNGVTTIRDAAGNAFGLKHAIDAGYVIGPRIFPSGAMISQTSGHGDQRTNADPTCFCEPGSGSVHRLVKFGDMVVADGPSEVRKAARENLRLGATQVKLAVGGGVASPSDPLDVVQYSPEEIRAAVETAEDYNTYVMAHVYNARGVRRAVECGVRSIEHANLIDDEETMRYAKERDVWLSPQVSVYRHEPTAGFTKDQIEKHYLVYDALDTMFTLAQKVGYENIVFGTDIIGDLAKVRAMNEEFVYRTKWFTPAQILRQATGNGGRLLQLSRRYNPGLVGVIEEGALADILLVDGNPLDDISIMSKPHENIVFIMKDGKVYKNTLS